MYYLSFKPNSTAPQVTTSGATSANVELIIIFLQNICCPKILMQYM